MYQIHQVRRSLSLSDSRLTSYQKEQLSERNRIMDILEDDSWSGNFQEMRELKQSL